MSVSSSVKWAEGTNGLWCVNCLAGLLTPGEHRVSSSDYFSDQHSQSPFLGHRRRGWHRAGPHPLSSVPTQPTVKLLRRASLREVRRLAQGHPGTEWLNWDWTPPLSGPRAGAGAQDIMVTFGGRLWGTEIPLSKFICFHHLFLASPPVK